MSILDPDDDALELEVEEFRELYAEDPAVADEVHVALLGEHPERPALADAVVDSLIAGYEMHDDEDPIVDIVDACRRLMPLEPVVDHLRASGQEELAGLLGSASAAAGRWLHEGGWVVHDDAGAEIALVFSRRGVQRTWVLLFEGAL